MYKNTSGIDPCGDKVLVLPEEIPEEITPSGIVITQQTKRRREMGEAKGVLVAVGPEAWVHSVERKYTKDGHIQVTTRSYKHPWASPGDTIIFAKYGGIEAIGEDGKTYRIINDEDVTAKVSEGVHFFGDLDGVNLGEARVPVAENK